MTELNLASTEELIKELMSRTTFLGVLIYMEGEYKGKSIKGKKWKARFSPKTSGKLARPMLEIAHSKIKNMN